jgi:hypothetical protein
MPRIVRVVENVIRIQTGQLPAASAAFWYSGRGADAPTVDPGGAGGTPSEGRGLPVGGLHADVHALHVVVDAWGPGTTGIEVTVEVNRAPGGALEWASVDRQMADVAGQQLNVRPFRVQILKADFSSFGQSVVVRLPIVTARLRWGVRGLGSDVSTTVLHGAYEASSQMD